MITKSRTSYFLRINNEFIIDLEDFAPDMGNYGRLNVFTGMFQNTEELVNALKHLQLLPLDVSVNAIDVVRRKGNKKDGYYFEPIEEGFVFKDVLPLLSVNVLKNFLTLNIDNYEVIYDAFEHYVNDLKQDIDVMRKSIDKTKRELQYAFNDAEKVALKQKIKNKESAYQRFLKEYHIISTVCSFTKQIEDGEFTSMEFRTTHVEMIEAFIDMETKYFRDGEATLNKRGLVKLAKRISAVLKRHENIRKPEKTQKYDALVNEFKKILKDFTITKTATHNSEEYVDPDTYMFLEEADYEGLRRPKYDFEARTLREPSQETLDSIANEIENLNFKKGMRK